MKAGDILREAAGLVDGARAVTYGDMALLHRNIAILWAAWLKVRRDPTAPLNAEDIAHMDTLKKMARSQCGEGAVIIRADNYVDAAAYQGIAGELSERPRNSI